MSWRHLLRHEKQEAQLDRELNFHIEEKVADLRRSGLSEEEARRKVRQEFGDIDRIKEEYRDARGTRWLDELAQDVRYAWRSLAKSPGFTAAALVALILGIGANTAIFSVIDAVLLRPLAFREPQRLMSVWKTGHTEHNSRRLFTLSEVERLRSDGAFASLGSFEPVSIRVLYRGEPEIAAGARISPDLITTLDVSPILGRGFYSGETNVALLSRAYWQRQFGSDPAIVGRTIDVEMSSVYGGTQGDRAVVTIVGVLPGELRLRPLDQADIWIAPEKDQDPPERRAATTFVVARLGPQGQPRTVQDLPNSRVDSLGWQINLVPVTETIMGSVRPLLLLLWAAAALVLGIACANLANLHLVRWSHRARELAIRAALGASGSRLARQLLVEGVLLALAGGACGLAAAYFCLKLLDLTRGLTGTVELKLDAPVLIYTACLSIFTDCCLAWHPLGQRARSDCKMPLESGVIRDGRQHAAGS